MITIETLCMTISGLDRADVEHWIAQDWVRPSGDGGTWQFGAIDVARVRLIRELRQEMQVEQDTLPLVLSLLDQLYDTRRQLRRLRDAVEQTVPQELNGALVQALRLPR